MIAFEQTKQLRAEFAALPADKLEGLIAGLGGDELDALLHDYELWARTNQRPPSVPWVVWLVMAGRGFGKTWVGANLVNYWAKSGIVGRIALVAEDAADARDVMVEGESGIIACAGKRHRPLYQPSKRRVVWPNGCTATIFTDSDPEALRGPQHEKAWVDELSKYHYAKETWSNLMFGMRIGKEPQVVVTCTPKPTPIIHQLVKQAKKDKTLVITRGSTYENRSNLSAVFFKEVVREYEGTTLGRQELDGELINLEEAGIVKRSWFRLWNQDAWIKDQRLKRQKVSYHHVLLSYDTAFTEKTTADYTACIAFGLIEVKGAMRALVLDCWREQIGFPELRKRVVNDYHDQRYGIDPDFKRQCDEVLVEYKGSGISLVQELQQDRIPAINYKPGNKDKTLRLHIASRMVKAGLVYLPESVKQPGEPRTWLADMLEEVCSFAGEGTTPNDDFVDAFSQALIYLKDAGHLVLPDRIEADEQDVVEKPPKLNPYAQ
ncbi:Terminase-like family [uncultured Caudovirales phage]|uniref:Terminase-like family n=1 Tax=uncultured Caudovirales phage TaxID=2100421 RepID=A0A6J5M8J8_9CAUD|nr:Terminase-like family [uncultured Caudovirales phage]